MNSIHKINSGPNVDNPYWDWPHVQGIQLFVLYHKTRVGVMANMQQVTILNSIFLRKNMKYSTGSVAVEKLSIFS